MREYKFRVYCQINRIMYTPEMDKEIKNLWAIPKAQGGLLNYPDGILMQSTGLKDKNGVEIYEGDIVNSWAGLDMLDSYIRVVTWVDGDACFKFNPTTGFTLCKNNEHLFEIIGNIHENPYLLEDK